MAEPRSRPPGYPLTADLAGVLAAARQERAPARGDGASLWSRIGVVAARVTDGRPKVRQVVDHILRLSHYSRRPA